MPKGKKLSQALMQILRAAAILAIWLLAATFHLKVLYQWLLLEICGCRRRARFRIAITALWRGCSASISASPATCFRTSRHPDPGQSHRLDGHHDFLTAVAPISFVAKLGSGQLAVLRHLLARLQRTVFVGTGPAQPDRRGVPRHHPPERLLEGDTLVAVSRKGPPATAMMCCRSRARFWARHRRCWRMAAM